MADSMEPRVYGSWEFGGIATSTPEMVVDCHSIVLLITPYRGAGSVAGNALMIEVPFESSASYLRLEAMFRHYIHVGLETGCERPFGILLAESFSNVSLFKRDKKVKVAFFAETVTTNGPECL
jgi:hypothetical protein